MTCGKRKRASQPPTFDGLHVCFPFFFFFFQSSFDVTFQLAQSCSDSLFPNMFNNLTVAEWLGPTRHPPRSLIRPILPWFFFVIDETCFFTYAQYVEPFSSSAVTINDLRHALVPRILQTWGIHFRSAMLHIQIADRHGQNDTLNGEHSLFQVLGAYHPLWFRGGDQHGYLSHPVSPFGPYVLRLTCTGATIDNPGIP